MRRNRWDGSMKSMLLRRSQCRRQPPPRLGPFQAGLPGRLLSCPTDPTEPVGSGPQAEMHPSRIPYVHHFTTPPKIIRAPISHHSGVARLTSHSHHFQKRFHEVFAAFEISSTDSFGPVLIEMTVFSCRLAHKSILKNPKYLNTFIPCTVSFSGHLFFRIWQETN